MGEFLRSGRLVVIGKNSKIWGEISRAQEFDLANVVAIGHADLVGFTFVPGDQVWVLSYSRLAARNLELLEVIAQSSDIYVTYVSSASTNVVEHTKCYTYPTIKYQAEKDAVRVCNARIVQIGWFYADANELPAGRTAATSLKELVNFMLSDRSPSNSNNAIKLFQMVERPFHSAFERLIFKVYGCIFNAVGSHPCILRPVDFFLRCANMRWYGYLFLSNKLWSMTI